jgi:hypothetical protein
MSLFYQIADEMESMLSALPALAGLAIVSDRQREIGEELVKAMRKQSGKGLLVITWVSATNEDPECEGPRLRSDYTLTLFSKPVLRGGGTPADDLIETILRVVHHWRPTIAHTHYKATAEGVVPVDHPELLVQRMTLNVITQL